MKAHWLRLSNKLDALSKRERWMVLLAGLVVIYAVLNAVLLGPVLKKKARLINEINQAQTQMADASQQLAAFAQNPVPDPDQLNREKITQVQAALQVQSRELSALENTLISPQAMPDLLKGLLQKNSAIKLLAMKTLPPENILQQDKSAEAANAPAVMVANQPLIYKHSMEITIAGHYLDLLHYAEALQSLPLHILWSKASLQSKQYPENELTLTLYTLSLDKTWLSI
ncbi:MAG: MSHA biogenesis protein MshJ [Methylophilaceae bacterium]